ncbi:hypothetical protein E2C01_047205 [Portunus trituberculatus]|uniref:Uncharacterized protein n=1 Tax=Portunus trituberculatus TaxID=210409 RepID=A0A5B7G7C4_PORTR|nr:hypothetical protein [Portunus trituberculatus]
METLLNERLGNWDPLYGTGETYPRPPCLLAASSDHLPPVETPRRSCSIRDCERLFGNTSHYSHAVCIAYRFGICSLDNCCDVLAGLLSWRRLLPNTSSFRRSGSSAFLSQRVKTLGLGLGAAGPSYYKSLLPAACGRKRSIAKNSDASLFHNPPLPCLPLPLHPHPAGLPVFPPPLFPQGWVEEGARLI